MQFLLPLCSEEHACKESRTLVVLPVMLLWSDNVCEVTSEEMASSPLKKI